GAVVGEVDGDQDGDEGGVGELEGEGEALWGHGISVEGRWGERGIGGIAKGPRPGFVPRAVQFRVLPTRAGAGERRRWRSGPPPPSPAQVRGGARKVGGPPG